MKTDYSRKVRALIYLLDVYRMLVGNGKRGHSMEIMYSKIVQLNSEIKEIEKQTPVPFGKRKMN